MSDAEINRLIKKLGETINETLAESQKINERLQEIKDAGYEIYLVIEAKVGFSPNDSGDPDNPGSDVECEITSEIFSDDVEKPVCLRITPEDAKFLKSLKISAD